MRVLVISGRARVVLLADICAFEAEDVAVETLQADLWTDDTDPATLADSYDLALVFGISFFQLTDIKDRALAQIGTRLKGPVVGYVFGGYGYLVRPPENPFKRVLGRTAKRFAGFSHIYAGIADDVAEIEASIAIPTTYLPMAADVLSVGARPYAGGADRPIAVNAYGRQDMRVVDALADRFNRPSSTSTLYATNFLETGKARDLPRYRAMFWQMLRQSKLAMCYDHFHANQGDAKLSYVGPRWFEALAAGAVVVGKAPPTTDRAALLDWRDATIDLPDDPIEARDAVSDLLNDAPRLIAASRENLRNMALRHDWAHRLATLLERQGLPHPAPLSARITTLAGQAKANTNKDAA